MNKTHSCQVCGALLYGSTCRNITLEKCLACGTPWAVEETDIDEWGFEDPTEVCPKCDGDRFVDHPYEDRYIQCDLCLGTGEIW